MTIEVELRPANPTRGTHGFRVIANGTDIGVLEVRCLKTGDDKWAQVVTATRTNAAHKGAFAIAYSKVLDSLALDGLRSDGKMSTLALSFWLKLEPAAGLRKFLLVWKGPPSSTTDPDHEESIESDVETIHGNTTLAPVDDIWCLVRSKEHAERFEEGYPFKLTEQKRPAKYSADQDVLQGAADLLEIQGEGTIADAIAYAVRRALGETVPKPNAAIGAIQSGTIELSFDDLEHVKKLAAEWWGDGSRIADTLGVLAKFGFDSLFGADDPDVGA